MKTFGRLPPGSEPTPAVVLSLVKSDERTGSANDALRVQVLREIDSTTAAAMSPEVLERQIETTIHRIANDQRLEVSGAEQARLAHDITADIVGFGPLTSLLLDDTVNDIMVNSPTMIYVERNGHTERVSSVRFRDNDHVMEVGRKIATRVGRRVDESSPMVDARLPDGSRVNIVFPPIAIDGACISIRKFPKYRIDVAAMVANGTMNPGIAKLLEIASSSRLNVLISGGTGSGKTTLLNALSRFINDKERIVTIEDAAELQLQQPHVIRLETRPASLEGGGMITQRDLVWNALRMRPDRIIVGEVRGAEAFDMLQAMNTGHDGSISTVHANNARDALMRVENMVQMGHVNLPSHAIRTQVVSALDIIVQIERMRDGRRRVVQITEVCGMEGDVITTNDIAKFNYTSEDSSGRLSGHYTSALAVPVFVERLAYFGLDHAWRDANREVVA